MNSIDSSTPSAPRPLFVLLTDFGLGDPYVGQLKGRLAALAPEVPVVDLCHGVIPHNVEQAAFFLESSLDHFPEGSIFVCVVDPGVGSDRRIVLAMAENRAILAPDNGLLPMALAGFSGVLRDVTPDPDIMPQASTTFHGRDIFAPLAAQLALGESPHNLGVPMDRQRLVHIETAPPALAANTLTARVIHADRFGNLILNLDIDSWLTPLEKRSSLHLATREGTVHVRMVRTYAGLGSENALGLLPGSQGRLELAMNMHSASQALGLEPGHEVRLLLDHTAD